MIGSARSRQKKWYRQVLHEARHARYMRADLASPAALEALSRLEKELVEAWDKRAPEAEIEARIDALAEQAHAVYPPKSYPRVRENVEVFTVAICVAMAFRTYFIQPFKIPTGSMEPTLFGIKVDADAQPTVMDRFPFWPLKFLMTGERYMEVKARASGRMDPVTDYQQRNHYLRVGGMLHKVHKDMALRFRDGNHVVKGQVLASGRVRSGDHIFVNKLRYNFTKPRRGEVVVFRTQLIRHPEIVPTDHYIKRLVGLENERISIQPPYLLADGEQTTDLRPVREWMEGNREAYSGYNLARSDRSPPPLLRRPTDVLQIGRRQFLPMGDNTNASLDGRYFGAVPMESLLGPAFAVYWPFGERWGLVR